MRHASTLYIGWAGHKESLAVADVATEPDAAVISRGTRQADSAQRLRKRPSQAYHWLCVAAAGPGGSWRSRSLTKKNLRCGVVAPAWLPKQAGDRLHTARRNALPLARLRRAGDVPPVAVPTVDADAIRALRRAREVTLRALNAPQWRLNAFWLRPAMRYMGRATGSPAHLRGLSAVGCPTPAPPMVCHADGRAIPEPTDRLPRLAQELLEHVHTW
jgi:transposase